MTQQRSFRRRGKRSKRRRGLWQCWKQYACRMSTWVGGFLKRVLQWLWSVGRRMTGWVINQFLGPVTCLTCHWVGVVMSTSLPLSVILLLLPGLNIDSLSSTITMWERFDLSVIDPKAAGTIAVLVFKFGGRQSWKRSRGSLGDKMIQACGAGIAWQYTWVRKVPSLIKRRGQSQDTSKVRT